MTDKPSITEVVGNHVQLRPAGKEQKGLCPFHAEKTPSFTVNEKKGLFYCHGCHEGGDVIDFVMKHDGLTFPEALVELGINRRAAIHHPKKDRVRQKAEEITVWANAQSRRANALLREIGQRLQLAKDTNWREEQQICEREWSILEDLAEDLQQAKLVIELYHNRAAIEALLADPEPDELPEPFPELTESYCEQLRRIVWGEV